MTDDQKFDIYYGYAYNDLCQSLYARLDFVTTFIQLVGGSAAAAGVLTSAAWLVGTSGVVLAICAAIGVTVQPAIKADRHQRAKCHFWDIKAQAADQLEGYELDAAITRGQSDAPMGIKTLELPAYNRTLHMLGYQSGFEKLRTMETLLQHLAG